MKANFVHLTTATARAHVTAAALLAQAKEIAGAWTGPKAQELLSAAKEAEAAAKRLAVAAAMR